jgi:hypothetical protein
MSFVTREVTFDSVVNETRILSTHSQKTQIPCFIKIISMGAELLHADGQTDRQAGAKSRFSQFCKGA